MNLEILEHFKSILGDLEYAKNFKCPYVVFTSKGQAIGLGEGMFFMKTELNIQRSCTLRDMVVICKGIPAYLKEVEASKDIITTLDDSVVIFKKNPVSLDNTFGSIDIDIAANYTENIVKRSLLEAESMPVVYSQEFSKEDKFMIDMKALKSDMGCVTLNINNKYFVMVHKKILNFKTADKISLEILDNESMPYYFAKFITAGKGYIYNTYMRILRV